MWYAEGCYTLGCYAEAAAECSEIIIDSSEDKQLQCQAKLLKGKALFYCYQRKIMFLMEKKSQINKEEEKRLTNECFESTKEVIYLLGGALDGTYIDEEGSKLLDWSMMDCIRETNQLNICKRCFLCRRRDQILCKSHIFPKFQLSQVEDSVLSREDLDKSQKLFVFGLDKHQMKSAGECWLWLCCKRCEGIMTQNAENEFSLHFPSSGTVEYTSWLFNYCCTILFRTLSCVKFPRSFNDDEVYEALLCCRKHMLSLPAKTSALDAKVSEAESYQLKLLAQAVTKEIKPYLFVFPTESKAATSDQDRIGLAIPWLAPHRLIDSRKDLAGQSHFFAAYCKGIAILLQFHPSAQCVLPRRCCVLPQSGSYCIPEAEEVAHLIPKGLWMLQHRSTLKYYKDLSEVFQQIAPRAAEKMVLKGTFRKTVEQLKLSHPSNQVPCQDDQNGDITATDAVEEPGSCNQDDVQPGITLPMRHDKPQLSMLPPDFTIVKRWPKKQIKLPQGHQIVLHLVEDSCGLTVFLAVGKNDHPYVIYLLESSRNVYVDGAFITEIDKEICFKAFLLENPLCTPVRVQVKEVQDDVKTLVTNLLCKYGFLSLSMFTHHYRLSIRVVKGLLSVGLKCSPEGCWYCRDLCHCCMEPALPLIGEENAGSRYRFCSQGCMTRYRVSPSQMPQSTFAIDHRDEFREGKFKGPSVLEVVNIYREENDHYNTFEFLGFCLGDGSDGLTLGDPYILWQVRSINSQVYMNFRVTEECVPLEILWCQFQDKEEEMSLLEHILKKESKLVRLLEISVRALGCEDVHAYLKNFTM